MRHVVLACDDNYSTPLKVAVYSYCQHNPEPAKIHILYEVLSESHLNDLRVLLESFGRDYELIAHAIPKGTFLEGENCSVQSTATCFRYLIGTLLTDVSRALYLDTDILVRGNLQELFQVPLEGKYAAVCKDSFVMSREWFSSWANEFGVAAYFNAGVLSLNLEKIRKNSLQEYFVDLDGRGFQFRDQDVLNIAFENRVEFVSEKFNLCSFDLRQGVLESPVIVHYTGGGEAVVYAD